MDTHEPHTECAATHGGGPKYSAGDKLLVAWRALADVETCHRCNIIPPMHIGKTKQWIGSWLPFGLLPYHLGIRVRVWNWCWGKDIDLRACHPKQPQ